LSKAPLEKTLVSGGKNLKRCRHFIQDVGFLMHPSTLLSDRIFPSERFRSRAIHYRWPASAPRSTLDAEAAAATIGVDSAKPRLLEFYRLRNREIMGKVEVMV
jgi:hypothetical protein